MTASMTPVASPHSTGRVGAGTDAAGTVERQVPDGLRAPDRMTSAVSACRLCLDPAVPGDDLALCAPHGGLSWADFDEQLWLAGREAC